MPKFSLSEVVAIVFLIGFAIQQLLQILDPFVMAAISKYKNGRPNKDLPGGMADADFKKAVMSFLAFVMGAIATWTVGVKLLDYIPCDLPDGCFKGPALETGNFLITSLVLGSGTEAVNIVLKFMGYVKDAQKPELGVSIEPNAVKVAKNATFRFKAAVRNATNKAVEWEVLHGNGGKIDQNGLYTAPNTDGQYQIRATSKADSSKSALAIVTVE